MAANRILFPSFMPAENSNADRIPGAKAYFFGDGTTTLAQVFVDNTLTTQLPNPVVADAVGVWPPMWADTATVFTVALTDSVGVPLSNGAWTGVSAANDGTLASVALSESARIAAEAAETAAAASATAAAASAAQAAATVAEFGDLEAAVTAAEASATAAAASAAAAAVFDPTLYISNSRTVSAGGLATGGGDLSADRTITVAAADANAVRTGTSGATAVTPLALSGSAGWLPLIDATTVVWNVASGYNAKLTLTANGHTVGAPTGMWDGQVVVLNINPATYTNSWDAVWDFGALTAPTLPASVWSKITAQYNAARTKWEASVWRGA